MHDCCLCECICPCVHWCTGCVYSHGAEEMTGHSLPSFSPYSLQQSSCPCPLWIWDCRVQCPACYWILGSEFQSLCLQSAVNHWILAPQIFALFLTFASPEQCHFEKLGAGFSMASMQCYILLMMPSLLILQQYSGFLMLLIWVSCFSVTWKFGDSGRC